MYHGHSATDRKFQRPIRNRGKDKKEEYTPPVLQGAKDLDMTERMEHLHPHRVTNKHPFPLKPSQRPFNVFLSPHSCINQLEMKPSLLGVSTEANPLQGGKNHHLSNLSETSLNTQKSLVQISCPNL